MMNLTSKWLSKQRSQTAYLTQCTADWLRIPTTTSSMKISRRSLISTADRP
ncbi:MAG: hypothetical protein U0L73_13370 [Ruminococcus bromii]|nr:hypothetical protein [Ruminococcus bromii]